MDDQTLPFQYRVLPWLVECFGRAIADDTAERNHRFLEESLELVQSCGCTASEAHQLVDYVFGRPVGEKKQESGGVSVTHAALCLANDIDMDAAAEAELARIWTKVEQIRAKQASKPKHSPLPAASTTSATMPVNVIFDGPPGSESGRFVEVETDDGQSISIGEWKQRPDGSWALRIVAMPDMQA